MLIRLMSSTSLQLVQYLLLLLQLHVSCVHVKNQALIFVVKHVKYGSTVIVHLGMTRILDKMIGSAATVGNGDD